MTFTVFIALKKRIRSLAKIGKKRNGIRLNTAESVMFMVVGGKPVFKIITGKRATSRTDKRIRKSGAASVSFLVHNNKPILKLLND